jgi:hypothetical protein
VYSVNEEYSENLFRRLRSADSNDAGNIFDDKGVYMLFRRLSQFLAAAALAIAFVVFAGAAGGSEAKAQGIYYYRANPYARHIERERARECRRREDFRREGWRRNYYRGAPFHNFERSPYHRR